MRELTTTRVLMITVITLAFLGVLVILAPQSEVKAEETALSSPGITISKQFKYGPLMAGVEWEDKDFYLQGLEVDVYYKDCWLKIGTFYTNDTGWIEFSGVPAGLYAFVWECGGVEFKSFHYACCNAQHHIWVNEIEPKGEQRATSSFTYRVHLLPGIPV